ncbi:MAG: hypothetical protein A3E88_04505 [Legionellales bacterium RIFCSPHIGHO2_12_FULL_35_11]|nr:MAG: hypothetical protein A3E88_04505 [Legionellales bacterium RIFCSPHIGHO2_12_FULL_35_11]
MPKNIEIPDEEVELFRASMRGVTPLKVKPKNRDKIPKSTKLPSKNNRILRKIAADGGVHTQVHDNSSFKSTKQSTSAVEFPNKYNKQDEKYTSYNLSTTYFHTPVSSDTILSFSRHGISKKRLLEIKNAIKKYEAKLDLHGMHPDLAAEALSQFIQKQSKLGHRLLLIVHGKGGKNGEAPILKNLISIWLPEIAEVLLFNSALSKDGGAGAVYVLLKNAIKVSCHNSRVTKFN